MSLDIGTFLAAHRERLVRWATLICRNADDARDIAHDVVVRLLRRPPSLTDDRSLRRYVRRALVNEAIDRSRRPKTTRLVREPVTDSHGSSIDREDVEQLRAAMSELSKMQRLVLVCKVCDEMSFSQIAAELDIGVSTAKTHYVRALMRTRSMLSSRDRK